MADIIRCKRCGEENPAEARFCIDCGAPLSEAATGATTKLSGMACPWCNARNPENARFCVICGRDLAGGQAPRPAPARPSPRPARPHPAARQSYPRVAAPPTLTPYRPAAPPRPRGHARGGFPIGWIFGIGLFILLINGRAGMLFNGRMWPGILLVVGLIMFFNHASNGRADKGLSALLWLGGLALLFATGSFWPGILFLLVLHAMLGGWSGRGGWRW
jgi:hypothetical protein